MQLGFELKDALEQVLAPSWARFGCSRASLGGSLGVFAASRWQLSFAMLFILAPEEPSTAPQAPSWRGRWPHEATKAHLETYFDLFPRDFGTAIGKKYKKHSYCPFEAIIGYRVPIHSLPKLQEQRGGLRVSALGSAALLPLAWSCLRRLKSWLYRKLPQA